MLATPHILTGAAIGMRVRRVWLALTAAFASHFLLDCVPHLDSHGLFGVPTGGPTRPEAIAAVLDFASGCFLAIWLVRERRRWKTALLCGLSAVLIDLFDNVPPLSVSFRRWPLTGWLCVFHHGIQHNTGAVGWPLGFGTQIAAAAIALWVIRGAKRTKGAESS